MKQLNDLLAQEREFDIIIEENKYNDPAEISRIKNDVNCNIDAINRWTDNIFAVKKFLVKKANRSGKEVSSFMKYSHL